MRLKKVMAACLAGIMVMGLAACGSADSGNSMVSDSAAESTAAESSQAETEGEPYNIVMQVVTIGENPSGLEDVEKAINDIVKEELGVTVTLYPVSVSDLQTQTNLMLTSGEKLDLIFNFGTGVADYVNKGMIIELDELYEKYGGDIRKSQGIAVAGGYYGGKLYGIPSVELSGKNSGFLARTDILEELGFQLEEGKIYTLKELTDLFAKYKEKYGDGYYCLAGLNATSDLFANFYQIDLLGGTTSNGVLMGAGLDGNTKVENLFATEKYAAYAKQTYEWAQAGYISPDAATNTDSPQMQVLGGHYFGTVGNCAGDGPTVFGSASGADITAIPLVESYATTTDFSQLTWSIPSTCENPEKTFQFLNLLYQERDLDKDIDTLLTLGMENVSYKFLERGEGSRGIITYADGVDASTTPYNMTLGIYGDKLSQPKWSPLTLDYYDEVKAFNDGITEERTSCTLGYIFDASSVASQKAAVDSVVSQYTGLVASGSLHPDKLLPEFLEALEAAGINDVIAENQAQLDAWLAENGK